GHRAAPRPRRSHGAPPVRHGPEPQGGSTLPRARRGWRACGARALRACARLREAASLLLEPVDDVPGDDDAAGHYRARCRYRARGDEELGAALSLAVTEPADLHR